MSIMTKDSKAKLVTYNHLDKLSDNSYLQDHNNPNFKYIAKRYLNNEFRLEGLGKTEESREDPQYSLNGKYFNELPLQLQERLEDTQLTLYILDHKAPEKAKFDIFERVNSGVPLNRQQMRNCLYSGKATKWLRDAAASKNFLKATNYAWDSKKMRDREAINRFCAFKLNGWEQYKGDMEDFLSQTLERMNQLDQDQLDELRNAFDQSMKINHLLFGIHAFRKSLRENKFSARRTPINISLFDVCSVLFSDIEKSRVESNKKILREHFRYLMLEDDFEQSITSATHSIKQVKTRFELAEATIREALS